MLDFPDDLKGQLRTIRERAAILNLGIQAARANGVIGEGVDAEALEASAGWLVAALMQVCDRAGVDELEGSKG
jgi:hypothetical protein